MTQHREKTKKRHLVGKKLVLVGGGEFFRFSFELTEVEKRRQPGLHGARVVEHLGLEIPLVHSGMAEGDLQQDFRRV